MKYHLYITDHCPGCHRVQEYMEQKGLDFEAVDLDRPGQEWPENVMIVPALVQGKRLLAVGPDIVDYLQKRAPKTLAG